MNKLFSITAMIALCLTFISNVSAQKEMTEGMITMELTELKADSPEMEAQMGMLKAMKGSTNVIAFNAEKSYMKMDMMGGMMGMTTITDRKTNAGFLLVDIGMMGMKNKVIISPEDVDKKKQTEAVNNMKVTYDKSDTKEIAGYSCYKATITSGDGEGPEITAYVTEAIAVTTEVIQGISADLLSGFPLEYGIGAQGMTMIYKATEVKFTADPALFNVNTDGYDEMTMEEFQSKFAAMGGGMGF